VRRHGLPAGFASFSFLLFLGFLVIVGTNAIESKHCMAGVLLTLVEGSAVTFV